MNDGNGLNSRLKNLRTALSITQKKLSEVLNCSQGKVSDYESGKLSISNVDLSTIANTYNINLTWLVTGKGPMFNINVPARARTDSFVQIPVVADIAAGNGIEAFDVEPEEHIAVHISMLPVAGPYYAFRVSGDSMAPYITTNDLAIVTQSWHDLDIQDRILAFRTHNGLTLKRFHIEKGRKFSLLIPLNPTYPIIKYTEDDPDYTVLGLLLLIIRRF